MHNCEARIYYVTQRGGKDAPTNTISLTQPDPYEYPIRLGSQQYKLKHVSGRHDILELYLPENTRAGSASLMEWIQIEIPVTGGVFRIEHAVRT